MSEEPSHSRCCERCGTELVSCLFCFDCSSLQPLSPSTNYFYALGIPDGFELDLTLLEEQFRQIAGELHPDFYMNSSSAEKKLSGRASTLLNQAYDNLKDSFKRATYLMRLKGKGLEWNERVLPPGFLEEMFSLQEELDTMLEKQDQPGLKRFQDLLDKRRRGLECGLIPLFRMLESVKELEVVLEQLQMKLNAERYLQSLLDRIQVEETT